MKNQHLLEMTNTQAEQLDAHEQFLRSEARQLAGIAKEVSKLIADCESEQECVSSNAWIFKLGLTIEALEIVEGILQNVETVEAADTALAAKADEMVQEALARTDDDLARFSANYRRLAFADARVKLGFI